MRRMGMGKVRLRNGIHYLHWYAKGQERREAAWKLLGIPAAQVTMAMARQCLKDRVAAKWTGTVLTRQDERVTVGQLLEDLEAARLNAGIKRPTKYKAEMATIRGWWGSVVAAQLEEGHLDRLVREKLDAGWAPSTVRNRLTMVHAALKKAARRLPPLPVFPKIRTPATRHGEFTLEETATVCAGLEPVLADVVAFGHLTGWRNAECRGLTWDRVDLAAGLIRLLESKTGMPRWRPLPEQAMRELLARRHTARALGCPFVFHRGGRAIPSSTFYLAFGKACRAAGLQGRFFHDFRRTAYNSLLSSGADLSTAMDIIGHESITSAKRYAQPNVKRMGAALARVAAAQAAAGPDNSRTAGASVVPFSR